MVNYDIHCTPKPVEVSVIRLYKQSSPCSILWGSNHNSILKIITQMRSEHKDRHQNGSKSHLLNINHLNKIPGTGRNEVKHQRLSIYKVERKMNQKTRVTPSKTQLQPSKSLFSLFGSMFWIYINSSSTTSRRFQNDFHLMLGKIVINIS